MDGEKTALQFRNEPANSAEDVHRIFAVFSINVSQIDLFESAVVADLERVQTGDGFQQG